MIKIYNPNKTSDFLNPWFDIFLLAGFPTVLIIMFLVYLIYTPIINWRMHNYIYTAFNLPHIIAGLTIIVHLYRWEWKEKPLQFLLPLIIFISIIIFFLFLSQYRQQQLAWLRYIWGGLHMLIQDYYIIGIYKSRNHDYLKLDKTVDTLFLLGLYAGYLILPLLLYMSYSFGLSGHNFNILNNTINSFLKNYWNPFIQFIVIAFILRQVYLFFQYKKIYPFKILMLSAIFISYYYLLSLDRERYTATASQSLLQLHNIKWIFWVWFYHRQRFKETAIEGSKPISYLFQPGRAGLYILSLILISIVFNYFLTFRIAQNQIYITHDPLALFHFFIEVFIWKASSIHRVINVSA